MIGDTGVSRTSHQFVILRDSAHPPTSSRIAYRRRWSLVIVLRRSVPLLVILALSLGSSACADESATPTESLPMPSVNSAPPTEKLSMASNELDVVVWDTEKISPDPATVDPANARLTVVAANLACARQSTSFKDLDGIAALEQQLLDAHVVTTKEFAAFNAEQAQDSELRSVVRDLFVANCSPA